MRMAVVCFLHQIEGALEAVAEVEAVVSEGVRLLEARSDAFAVETRPGEIWITGELAILRGDKYLDNY